MPLYTSGPMEENHRTHPTKLNSMDATHINPIFTVKDVGLGREAAAAMIRKSNNAADPKYENPSRLVMSDAWI